MSASKMKAIVLVFGLFLILGSLSYREARAYSVVIEENGSIAIYQENVLGEQDAGVTQSNYVEVRTGSQTSTGNTLSPRELELKRDPVRAPSPDNVPTPVPVRLPSVNSRVELEQGEDGTRVLIEQRLRANQAQMQSLQEQIERIQETAEQEGRELTEEERKRIRELEERMHALQFRTLEERTETDPVRIELRNKLNIETRNGAFEIEDGPVLVRTRAAIRVDSQTGELSVVTPSGERVVSVLPEQAVTRLIENGIIDSVQTAPVLGGETHIELQAEGENVSYKLMGVKAKRFLGLFPVNITKELTVSPETGEVVDVTQPFVSRILELLSR